MTVIVCFCNVYLHATIINTVFTRQVFFHQVFTFLFQWILPLDTSPTITTCHISLGVLPRMSLETRLCFQLLWEQWDPSVTSGNYWSLCFTSLNGQQLQLSSVTKVLFSKSKPWISVRVFCVTSSRLCSGSWLTLLQVQCLILI